MDKTWIGMPRNTPEYVVGLNGFLDFAFTNRSVEGRIICPCSSCKFKEWQTREVVYDHLIVKPFPKGYTVWLRHGETSWVETPLAPPEIQDTNSINDPIHDMVNEAFGHHCNDESVQEDESSQFNQEMPNDNADFLELINDGQQCLYEGCDKYSKLSFLVKLYHIKCLCKISNKGMSMILELLADAFEHAKIPSSFYEAKKTISKLGLDYTKIHACPNDCMLYFGEDKNRDSCKRCNTSRWKAKGNDAINGTNKRKKPAKVLRYFPLKPRLQRLFMSSKTAEHMKWHASESNNDGILRHPRDSEAWKTFNLMHPQFASDPRNVRLGLSTDGFNPFGNLSNSYSIWPVVLIPYNLPPWMCMKPTSFILSMIIPGKRAPGNDIDVYLQPLVEELMELWNVGVKTFDSHSKEVFNMHSALMWTISDFPGLETLSGWNTHTGLACPTCNFDLDPKPNRLDYSHKWCFIGHRRFLNKGHKFRLAKAKFNGYVDDRNPPVAITGADVLRQVKNVNVTFGKDPLVKGRAKRPRESDIEDGTQQWRKKSIFFQLPYWVSNLLRHNLDIMHIEKNVCDNVIFTLLNEKGKSKDHANARRDLKKLGVRPDLWVDENGRYCPALFTLTKANKDIFLRTLKKITVPDGYSSNISRCIDLKQGKIGGLKSHDSHILMEQLLPLAMRNTLPTQVSAVLIDLCSFFKQLCAKVLKVDELDQLQSRVVLTLCHMEMLFPPSFFTVMVHLIVHLVEEVKLGGPVQYRWMYPIERYLGRLKSYIGNMAQPEGSIAEGYMAQEALTFCSRYLDGIETEFNRLRRVNDQPNVGLSAKCTLFLPVGKPIGGSSYFNLSAREKLQAHRHVLTNCKEVDPFLQEFRDILRKQSRNRRQTSSDIDKKVHREFVEWFSLCVRKHLYSHPHDHPPRDHHIVPFRCW